MNEKIEEISKIRIHEKTYAFKDSTAREKATDNFDEINHLTGEVSDVKESIELIKRDITLIKSKITELGGK